MKFEKCGSVVQFHHERYGVNMRKRETDRTKANCPRYTLSDKMITFVAEITEVATRLEMRERNNK